MTVSMASNQEILLEKWESSEKNLILRAGNIAYTKATISQYYVAMMTTNDKRAVVRHKNIRSNKPF